MTSLSLEYHLDDWDTNLDLMVSRSAAYLWIDDLAIISVNGNRELNLK